jgi:hypothetical protein
MSLEVTKQELLKQAIYLSKLYATTRVQDYKDQETRIRRIIVDLENFTGGGSGPTSLNDLTDVTIAGVLGDQLLKYNSTTSQWENWTPDYISDTTVRTVDTYLATAGQVNFTITAASYDFLDVYVNGARLISSEYTVASSTVTLSVAAELNDEIIILSYYSASLASLPKEYILRHDFVSPYSYCGKAVVGSLETQSVWDITRIEILDDGSTVLTNATDVDWTNHLTHTYT